MSGCEYIDYKKTKLSVAGVPCGVEDVVRYMVPRPGMVSALCKQHAPKLSISITQQVCPNCRGLGYRRKSFYMKPCLKCRENGWVWPEWAVDLLGEAKLDQLLEEQHS